MKHNKIALIGMMGSGKSTISKLLSEKLGYSLFELDEIFEQQEKIKIKDFFAKYKEEKFRKIEAEILKKSIKNDNFILSCGGGIILAKENRSILFENEILSIYLKTSPDNIFKRIKNDTSRPLLLAENPKQEIEKILDSREMYYNKAHIIIETDDKSQQKILEEILEEIWKK
ncbi:shikimate kinase [bacterium]|nr:shikimate kinase [bacterium]